MRAVPETWDPANFDVSPMPAPKRMQICTFRRTYTIGRIQANTGDTLLAYNFQLSSLPNYTEFVQLFDSYRILEAVLTFAPYSTAVTSNSGTASYPGLIGSWLDYDDSNLPANLQEGQQFDSYQRNTCTVPFIRVVRPRAAIAAYSGTFTSYGSVYGHWFDTASPSVQHYGLKLCVTGSSYATVTNIYEVEVTLTLQCRAQQ